MLTSSRKVDAFKSLDAGVLTPRLHVQGREVQVDSIKPPFLELNATRLINLTRANDVSSHDREVQVDSIKASVENAIGISA
jgi:hypothetical protein